MDLRTIIICLVVVNLFMGFFTFVIKRTQPTFPGINFWIASSFLIAGGYLLMVLRDHIPTFMSVLLAHTAFIIGGFLRITGLNRFFFIRQSRLFTYFLISVFYLFLIPDFIFTYFRDNILVRTVMLGTVLSGISLYTGVLILQNRPSERSSAYYFAAISYFAFSGIFIFRMTGWLFDPSVRGLFNSVFINNLQFISSIIIDIVWTTMFFVIHNQRINEQLQQSESNLLAMNKGKDRFLIVLAHDLKNVFNSIYNLSELILMKSRTKGNSETDDDVNNLYDTAEKGYNLLEDLLFWSASNTGNLKLNLQKTDFSVLYHAVAEKISHTALSKKISLNYISPEEPVLIMADFNMMQSVLRNLIGNSIKYSRTGDRIEVKIRKNGSMAEISVKDSGIGISASNQAKLWDISNTQSSAGTSGEKGTGLGLLLCRELIEKHGGNIRVESEEGKGSIFSFTVPLEP